MGGWVNGVGGEGAYLNFIVTSCHVRLAMGLVAFQLRIGAWSGAVYADWVCLRYFGCSIDAHEGGLFQCQCWNVYVCIYVCACVFWVCM